MSISFRSTYALLCFLLEGLNRLIVQELWLPCTSISGQHDHTANRAQLDRRCNQKARSRYADDHDGSLPTSSIASKLDCVFHGFTFFPLTVRNHFSVTVLMNIYS